MTAAMVCYTRQIFNSLFGVRAALTAILLFALHFGAPVVQAHAPEDLEVRINGVPLQAFEEYLSGSANVKRIRQTLLSRLLEDYPEILELPDGSLRDLLSIEFDMHTREAPKELNNDERWRSATPNEFNGMAVNLIFKSQSGMHSKNWIGGFFSAGSTNVGFFFPKNEGPSIESLETDRRGYDGRWYWYHAGFYPGNSGKWFKVVPQMAAWSLSSIGQGVPTDVPGATLVALIKELNRHSNVSLINLLFEGANAIDFTALMPKNGGFRRYLSMNDPQWRKYFESRAIAEKILLSAAQNPENLGGIIEQKLQAYRDSLTQISEKHQREAQLLRSEIDQSQSKLAAQKKDALEVQKKALDDAAKLQELAATHTQTLKELETLAKLRQETLRKWVGNYFVTKDITEGIELVPAPLRSTVFAAVKAYLETELQRIKTQVEEEDRARGVNPPLENTGLSITLTPAIVHLEEASSFFSKSKYRVKVKVSAHVFNHKDQYSDSETLSIDLIQGSDRVETRHIENDHRAFEFFRRVETAAAKLQEAPFIVQDLHPLIREGLQSVSEACSEALASSEPTSLVRVKK